ISRAPQWPCDRFYAQPFNCQRPRLGHMELVNLKVTACCGRCRHQTVDFFRPSRNNGCEAIVRRGFCRVVAACDLKLAFAQFYARDKSDLKYMVFRVRSECLHKGLGPTFNLEIQDLKIKTTLDIFTLNRDPATPHGQPAPPQTLGRIYHEIGTASGIR